MIHLDHNATTPVAPEVRQAMLPFLESAWGNPSSGHGLGRQAREAVARARQQVAALLGREPDEVVFTGGGSEADNLALKGLALARWPARGHLVTTAVEHPAVLAPARFLERLGYALTVVPVDREGVVDMAAVAAALRDDTFLVSVMHANNETGALQPVEEIAALLRDRGVPLHTDAAQSVGKVPVEGLAADLLTVAGHKLGAPKGVGALVVRRGLRLEPLVHGGDQEGGRRAGTENVAGLVGLGAACELASRELPRSEPYLRELTSLLERLLAAGLPGRMVVHGPPLERRLPNTLCFSIRGAVGAEVLARVPEVAASTGSACHSGQVAASPVLRAMGVPEEVGVGAIRLSLGRATTREEVERAAALLVQAAGPPRG